MYTHTHLRKHDLFLFRQLAAERLPKDKLDLSKATENWRRRECYTWLAVSSTMPIVPFPVNHTNFMPMLCKSRQGMSPPPTTYYLRPIEEAPPRAAVQNQHSTWHFSLLALQLIWIGFALVDKWMNKTRLNWWGSPQGRGAKGKLHLLFVAAKLATKLDRFYIGR